MPKAESGFAIASHYLLLAEGKRDVTIDLTVSGYVGAVGEDWSSKVLCSFTGEKGWIDVPPVSFQATGSDNFSWPSRWRETHRPLSPAIRSSTGWTFRGRCRYCA